ncbi:MAG: class F sortase [Ilumatobacteraceae bacterium]
MDATVPAPPAAQMPVGSTLVPNTVAPTTTPVAPATAPTTAPANDVPATLAPEGPAPATTNDSATPTPTTTTTTTPTTTTPTTTTPTVPNVRDGANVNAVADVGDPIRVIVPSAGIDGPVSAAGVLADNTVAVPPDPAIAGWFTGGPRPGELGPAVIVGHVDSKKSGPGVFYRLRDVKVGDIATIVTTTGSQQFVAVATERVPKNAFPTARVYGQVPTAALRLITCGGSFDSSIGHYRDNVVVYLVKAPS